MIGRSIRQVGTLAAATALLALAGCGGEGNAEQETQAAKPERIANVITTEIVSRPFTNYLDLVGEIEPWRRVTVSIEEVGVIDRIAVEKGMKIKKGAVLAHLEDDLLKAAANEAQASLKLSRLRRDNQKRLFDEEALSESAYLESQYQFDMAQARFNLASARLSKTTIRAPISGVLDTKELEVGELAGVSRSFADIVDIDRVKVVAGVPERHLRHVQINTNVTITFPAYPGMTREGQTSLIGTTIDSENRTVPMEIVIPNPDHKLKPEMASIIRIVKDQIPDAIVIPQDAVVDTDQGMIVFVAEGSVARAVQVVLGPISKDQVVVLEGLKAGMSLITIGHRDLVDGEPIRLRTP